MHFVLMSAKRWQQGQTNYKSVWNALQYGGFSRLSGAVLSFILENSTDNRQIAHDHACQIQLENQQPRYLARTINSGNFVHSCKYEFRKYEEASVNGLIQWFHAAGTYSRGLFRNELTTRFCCIENGEIPMYQQNVLANFHNFRIF